MNPVAGTYHQDDKTTQAPIRGVIFDLDGTLVSSSLDFSAIREEIGCPTGTDILTYIDELSSVEERQQAIDMVIRHELRDAQTSMLIEGVSQMLAQLYNWQIPSAVVTRNCLQATQTKLQRHNLSFETVLTRECAPPKPDPTALLQIASCWDIDPRNLIYVGDFVYDIQTAENAGMRSVLMAFGDLPHSEQPSWYSQATWCYGDYQDLLKTLEAVNF